MKRTAACSTRCLAHRRGAGTLRELIGVDNSTGPSSLTVYFLFRGDAPLELTLRTPHPQTIVAVPHYNPRQFLRLQRSWWQQYAAVTRLQEREGDYPPLVEVYLASMLGQRLGLRTPLLDRVERQRSVPKESLAAGAERRVDAHADVRGYAARPSRPRHGGSTRPATDHLDPPLTAQRYRTTSPSNRSRCTCPRNAFICVLAAFDNYLWLRKFTEQNGGSVNRLITLRGHDALLNQRVQKQLGLKETALAELLGNQLISDVALLGRDTYLREGAAIGIMFEARNGLLKNELSKQQREAVDRLQTRRAPRSRRLRWRDRQVSFASTPGNELRSFYVVDDRYHLVTNSLTIVQRFLEAGQGTGVAGSNRTIFAWRAATFPSTRRMRCSRISRPRSFADSSRPQYQIELRRRLQAVTDLEILNLAQRTAIHEQQAAERIEDLIAAGLLPAHFNQRPDGSQIVLTGRRTERFVARAHAEVSCRFRMLPLEGVTADEAERDLPRWQVFTNDAGPTWIRWCCN